VLLFIATLITTLGWYALGIRSELGRILPVFAMVVAIWQLLIIVTVLAFPSALDDTTYVPLSGDFDEEGSVSPFEAFELRWGIPAALAVAAILNVSALAPAVLNLVYPERLETRNAQEGFPLRAVLEAEVITFTNLSTEEWWCEVALGTDDYVSAAFQLPSHQSRTIKYVDFLPSRFMVGLTRLRSEARDQVTAKCTSADGFLRAGVLR
jgi:hypothetical protein